ncbi:MAG: tRNA pseudouridine(38-40) synthase TruA [Lentisphaeraceae bacterium]|nr:tRNA pseudouridine(38-40) synthase TruA [Lentisphaeraceae bacterium]
MQDRFWKVTVQYDGTAYYGWQLQPDQLSIQETIQKILTKLYTVDCRVSGSGRTDAGVHALGQVFSFKEPHFINLSEDSFPRALNALLPHDIRILKAEFTDESFHARFSTVGKTYVYVIDNSARLNLFTRSFSWNRRHNFDLEKTKAALDLFVGKHDFSGFTVNAHMIKGSPERTVYKASVEKWNGFYLLSFTGSGFLYKMVRSLTGQVVECAAGIKTIEKAKELLETGVRSKACQVAPAKGLFLGEVYYKEEELSRGLSTPASKLFEERFFN